MLFVVQRWGPGRTQALPRGKRQQPWRPRSFRLVILSTFDDASPGRLDLRFAGFTAPRLKLGHEDMTTQQAVRRWIMTGAVAAVTITGTFYGATLKSDVDANQVRSNSSLPIRLSILFHDEPSHPYVLVQRLSLTKVPHSKRSSSCKPLPMSVSHNSKLHVKIWSRRNMRWKRRLQDSMNGKRQKSRSRLSRSEEAGHHDAWYMLRA